MRQYYKCKGCVCFRITPMNHILDAHCTLQEVLIELQRQWCENPGSAAAVEQIHLSLDHCSTLHNTHWCKSLLAQTRQSLHSLLHRSSGRLHSRSPQAGISSLCLSNSLCSLRQIREGKQSQSWICPVEPPLQSPGNQHGWYCQEAIVKEIQLFQVKYIVIVHLHEVEVPLVKQNNDSANPSNTHLETQELKLLRMATMRIILSWWISPPPTGLCSVLQSPHPHLDSGQRPGRLPGSP